MSQGGRAGGRVYVVIVIVASTVIDPFQFRITLRPAAEEAIFSSRICYRLVCNSIEPDHPLKSY